MVTLPQASPIACVTGGSGFIGRRLVGRLLQAGYEVRVLTRSAAVHRHEAQVWTGDLLVEIPRDFLRGASCVFHCAGEVRNETRMEALHVGGTGKLLRAAVDEVDRSGTPLKWIQLSSVGAYGSPRGDSLVEVTEDSVEQPRSLYERTKTASDAMVRAASSGDGSIRSVLLRPSTVFGTGMPNGSVQALLGAIGAGRFFYIGRGDAIANFIHVDDVVAALLHCERVCAAASQTFIAANDCTLREVVEAVAAAAQVRPPRLRVPEPLVRQVVRLLPALPLTTSRVDALTRRVTYRARRLAASGFVPRHAVPEEMAVLYRAECRGR